MARVQRRPFAIRMHTVSVANGADAVKERPRWRDLQLPAPEGRRCRARFAGRKLALAASLVVCCIGAELPAAWLRELGIGLRELRGEPIGR